MKKNIHIAVFGSDGDHCKQESLMIAKKVGEELAKAGAVLLTGGGEGIMQAASQGAYEQEGIVIGILPGADKQTANKYCTTIIPTEIGFARGQILANAADAVIVIEGGIGTKMEVGEVYWRQTPIIALPTTGGAAQELANQYLDKRGLLRVQSAQTPQEAVEQAIRLGKNKLELRERLQEVGLDLDIYKKVPHKYIRINPRNPLGIKELEQQLKERYGIETSFITTGIPDVYRSSHKNIGGTINGKENTLFMKHYFIQDFASILAVHTLGLEKGDTYLDLCAAPGFKTILAHDLAKGNIRITALDIDEKRLNTLREVLARNEIKATILLGDSTTFKGEKHDKVLVDTECSCEGMIVKYDKYIEQEVSGIGSVLRSSTKEIRELNKLQLQLLQNGFNHLKEEGTLVYATCAMNKYENEKIIEEFLVTNTQAKVEQIDMSPFDINASVSERGVRILPGKTRGLYFTKIVRKKNKEE